jgi:hypothetical protein
MDDGTPFRLIDVLTKHNVPFVIIGGHAVSFHGYVRATEDIDIVVQRTPEAEQALLAALTGPYSVNQPRSQWVSVELNTVARPRESR